MSAAPINPPRPLAPPSDLEARVASRKKELISEIVEHKKNSSRVRAADEIDRIKAHLLELARLVTEGVVDGWANVGESVKLRLDEWIAK